MDLRDFSSRFRSYVSIAMETTEPLKGGVASPPSPTGSVKDMLTKGLTTLPLWSHIFFTGVLPFGPLIPYLGPFFFVFFHTFGANGVNLLVSNSMTWAAAKALVNAISTKIGDYIGLMYSKHWWAAYVKAFLYYANPWYVFDWVQAVGANIGQNEPFKGEGYKIPFANIQTDSVLKRPIVSSNLTNKSIGYMAVTTDPSGKKIKGAASYGLLSALPIAAILVLFMPALNLMVANLPPELQADIAPGINKIFYWIGTLSALVGGTVGATGMMGMIPNILEFMKPGPSVAAAAPVMSGGGGIPTVKEITEAMLNSENNQAGGGKEGTVFMGVLGFTVFAGLTLALVRGKHFPSAK
jgi:hypothetical protein